MAGGGRTLQRSPATGWRRTLDGVVVLATDHDPPSPLALTGPGGALWVLLAEPLTRDALLDALATRYGTTPDAIADDVDRVLEDLCARGAVTAGHGPDGDHAVAP